MTNPQGSQGRQTQGSGQAWQMEHHKAICLLTGCSLPLPTTERESPWAMGGTEVGDPESKTTISSLAYRVKGRGLEGYSQYFSGNK